eukprot:TRINITY_DN3333_c1_g1_i1.p2 TRINITY_DN3333_c1_g1~~TRINITY_DN3333_c1_g1_i1.p2  ORF type:complete len:121 (-),score=21.30 TRINITY_DN3333_c1_g1_i1:27-389(-)
MYVSSRALSLSLFLSPSLPLSLYIYIYICPHGPLRPTRYSVDAAMDFEFNATSQKALFPRLFRVDVFNVGMLWTESRLGTFMLELGRIYDQPNHQYFRRFFQLYDPADLTKAKGYIQVCS